MSPLYGEYISRIMRIAPETDAAAINMQTTTAAFSGANNPKLTKIAISQNTRVTSNGMEIETAWCVYCNQRMCTATHALLSAWSFSERWVSSFGESSWILSIRTSPSIEGATSRKDLVRFSGHVRS